MPVYVKVILTILTVGLGFLIGWYEFSVELVRPGWVSVILGVFLGLAIWAFPEVQRDDPRDSGH